MISLLVPTYNYSIIELVQELHAQAEKAKISYEIIIADDYSSDKDISSNNKNYILTLPDCRYIENEKNLGRTATRNILAKCATYECLLFLDADVIPSRKNFILNFIDSFSEDVDLIFGGIAYKKETFDPIHSLRWKFGKKREQKNVSQRNKDPYKSIISGCIFIRKECFIKYNRFLIDFYGSDILFTYTLKKHQAKVLHIDNTVFHLGLERNNTFIEKSKKAIKSLLYFESKGLLPDNYSSLQKAYLKLNNDYSLIIFKFIMKNCSFVIEKNLISGKPSLFLFDLYRLYYFILFKEKRDA